MTKLLEYITIEVRFDPEELNKNIKSDDMDDEMNREDVEVHIDEEKLAKRSRKYPLLAAEILCCDMEDLFTVIVSDKLLTNSLLSFIMPSHAEPQKPLDPVLSGYWIRVMTCLLQRKNLEVQRYILSDGDDNLVQSFIDRLDVVGMDEILLKLMGLESTEMSAEMSTLHQIKMRVWTQTGGKGSMDQWMGKGDEEHQKNIANWWAAHGVIDRAINKFTKGQDPDILASATRLLCEIIKRAETSRNNPLSTQLLSREVITKLIKTVLDETSLLREALPFLGAILDAGIDALEQQHKESLEDDEIETSKEAKPLPDPMLVIVTHLPDVVSMLRNPPQMESFATSFGTLDPPLGETRLRVIEFMSTLFHLADQCPDIEKALIDAQAPQVLTDLFFRYEYNNLLHGLFYRIFTFALSTNSDSPDTIRPLRRSFIVDCVILDRILEAERSNTIAQSQPKGMRKGYMGHLTMIANQIVLLASEDSHIQESIQSNTAWAEYVQGPLHERNQVESQPIGVPSPSSSGRSSPLYGDQQQVKPPLLDQKQQEELDKEFEMFDDDMEFDSSSSDDEDESNEKKKESVATDEVLVSEESQASKDDESL
jgi:serine/threonine-protein phosphatase 6 regulatory subunit 3